jgi:hypothetical protein
LDDADFGSYRCARAVALFQGGGLALGQDSLIQLLGIVKLKMVLRGKLGVAHTRPPCHSTIERHIDNPSPIIDFTEGQHVHIGDLLAQIDPRPYQAWPSMTILRGPL